MTRRGIFLLCAGIAFGASFIGSIAAAPKVVMAVAMSRLSDGGERINRWHFIPLVTEESQTVVRSSPDLAYAICAFDLGDGPLLVSQSPDRTGHYRSLSLYADNTDNFATFSDRTHPDGVTFVLTFGAERPTTALPIVRAPSIRGLILDRRVAPTAEAFAAVEPARRRGECRPYNGE